MGLELEIDAETGSATGRAAGAITLAEMKAAGARLAGDPKFAGSRVLWDLRTATFSPSASEIQELAEFVKRGSALRAPSRSAFVVAGDLEFGLVRVFGAYREERGVEVAVFRDLAEAAAWLAAALA